ncbi:MAG: AEC family transporter [Eubacteriales bacterium]|nr:AEC family transporter [Eubacteriales bacterium]
MNLSILLAQQIMVMAIMICLGFLFTKLKLISFESSKYLSQLCLYIIVPCMLINSFQIEFSVEKAKGFLLAFIAAILSHIALLIFGKIIGKAFHFSGVERASFIYTNAGNLIVPVVTYVLGKEYTFYCSAFMMVQIFLMWTHCISLVTEVPCYDLRKIMINPCIISTLLGMFLFFMGIKLPDMVGQAVGRIADCIGPISMIIVGILIASADLKRVFLRGKSWILSLFRLLVFPVLIVFILSLSHVTTIMHDADKILFVTFLALAAPSASTVTQMASLHNKNEVLAGSVNIMTVILCIITMPLVTMVYQYFCM